MSLDKVTLATGPVSFGVDFPDTPSNPPWPSVLDLIRQTGLRALELGPVGYLPEDREQLRAALRSRELIAAGSFVFEDLHDTSARDEVLRIARRACRAISAAGGQVLVIIDRPSPERAATAGRPAVAPQLPARYWRAMVDLIDRVADLAREHDLQPACHPHAGSYVEFSQEIDHLLMDTDIDLCLDTGHAAYAGMAAHEAIARYGSRIVHLHLKDTSPEVLDRARRDGLDFWAAISQGIFCPLGSGAVDLTRVAAELEQIGYAGFATIEQDRVPGTGSPLEDLQASIAVVHQAGIGVAPRNTAPKADADR
jgi:inosose dehydratase